MRYVPALALLGLAALCWLLSRGNTPGAAMSSDWMKYPAGVFGIVGVLAALAAVVL